MATLRRTTCRKTKLRLERLEDRQLLAGDFAVFGTPTTAPRVTAVKVASPSWSASFLDLIDTENVGYSIPHGPGDNQNSGQLSTLPWQNIQQIYIEFDEDVGTVQPHEIELTGSNRELHPVESVTYDSESFRATVSLASPIENDKLLLVVKDSIRSEKRLDGEWNDASTIGPSGDGTPGGDFRFRFNVLPGDINQSGASAVNDIGKLRLGLGSDTTDALYSVFADLNGSGALSVDDAAPLRQSLGTSIPVTEPMGVGDVLSSSGDVTFVYDPTLPVQEPLILGLEDGAPIRRVAASMGDDGIAQEYVENELVVVVSEPSEIDAVLARWNARVLDGPESIEEFVEPMTGSNEDPEYIIFHEYILQIDTNSVDTSNMAADLVAAEPYQTGEFRVSSYAGAVTAAAAASEFTLGTQVSLNFTAQDNTIASGVTTDAPGPFSTNAFNWPHISSDSEEAFNVDLAWKLLDQHGKLGSSGPRVKMLIVDRGFYHSDNSSSSAYNHDFAFSSSLVRPRLFGGIAYTDWRHVGGFEETFISPANWHGTDVTLAAMAELDNDYGTAGPAGPLNAEMFGLDRRGTLLNGVRNARKLVERLDDIDVVNMSFGRHITHLKGATNLLYDRHLAKIEREGALVVAGAGNDGVNLDRSDCTIGCPEKTLFLPCESEFAFCVGGVRQGTHERHSMSNFGGFSNRGSVQIYGPFTVYTLEEADNPSNNRLRTVAGTSVAAPFVSGVAAMVRAANPSLTPAQVRWALLSTAHNDTIINDPILDTVLSSKKRVDAFAAVVDALGLDTDISVNIRMPSQGSTFNVGDDITFEVDVTDDVFGDEHPVSWSSDRGGDLGEGSAIFTQLSTGTHQITATVGPDQFGQTATDTVTVNVIGPQGQIIHPLDNPTIFTGQSLDLIADVRDPLSGVQLADDDIRWTVRSLVSNQVVATPTGLSFELLPGILQFGSYHVNLSANGTSLDSRVINVVVPENNLPTGGILSPNDTVFFEPESIDVTPWIAFSGLGREPATRATPPQIPGTRYRWTAYNERGEFVQLCVGSSFPGAGTGGIVTPQDCSSFNARLDRSPNSRAAVTSWVVTLDIAYSDDVIISDSINIILAVPPVG